MSFNVHGHVINISWQPFCNSLDMIKPFLLAMAWLSAAFIMLEAVANEYLISLIIKFALIRF